MDSTKDNDLQNNHKIPGITAIGVKGFKSLQDYHTIDIRPLTILAGANSSGKSSILQPLLLLKQTLEASYDPGPLLLDGPNVRFTSAKQFLSKIGSGKQVNKFSISIQESDDEGGDELITTYQKKKDTDIVIESMQSIQGKSKSTLKPQMSEKALFRELPDLPKLLALMMPQNSDASSSWHIKRTRCFLELEVSFNQKTTGVSGLGFNPSESYVENIRKIIHIPGLRGNPTRTYKTTAFGSVFLGTFENYVASIVHHWQKTKDERIKKLEEFLYALGLTDRLEARKLDDTQVELQVGRLLSQENGHYSTDMINIADVGLGISQVLPVLVAVLAAEPGQLVYIEQPEIHLHPRTQAALANVLVEAMAKDIRIVVETHSALFLTAVQTRVAKGDIAGEKVMLHWFQRDEKGCTKISSTPIDETGTFGDWPEDFAEVSLQVESQYLEAVEIRLLREENVKEKA